MTNMSRLTVSLTPEIESKIIELRKTDRFCRSSLSEIIRALIMAGIATNLPSDPPSSEQRAG